ncbi:hypothetical protein NEUTE2DRAFT_118407 [Neurospora tetrasperma FGSC 2509]|nr:hypothetical protein NEUTE2DRAFT_118407 [Neurospora tetrasperma FGSC 2509]
MNAEGHRYRSRSPLPGGSRSTHHDRRRSRSRHRERSRSRDRERDRDEPPKPLPFNSRQLSRSDYPNFEPLFAQYLDIQKQLYIDDLDDYELRGRWKSFVKKWNRGELAEGWYDPERFAGAAKEAATESRVPRSIAEASSLKEKDRKGRAVSTMSEGDNPESTTARPSIETNDTPQPDSNPPQILQNQEEEEDDASDSDYGPTLPGQSSSSRTHAHGPTIPSLTDLTLHRETLAEESATQRASSLEALRTQRKADRALQKERLEDLVPRADAGTRERRLEKRKELNEKLKSFREPSPGGEVAESELMGEGDGGGLEEYKRMMKREEVKKTERQLRREEMERARAAEREKRIQEAKEREDRVMEGLKALAKARFG